MSTASPSPLLIRPAAPGDAPQLAEIQTAGGAAAGVGLLPADYLEHLLHAGKAHEHLTRPAGGQPAEAVLVAEAEAGRLAGYARVRRGSSIPAYDGELAALHVRQPDRGRGAGRQLVQAAAHWLQQAGAASLMLWAPAGSPACHFCEHLGARLIGRQSSRLDAPGQAAAGELAYGWPSLAHLLDGRPIDPLPALQALIFDIDGVLTYQGRVYPGAVDVIAGLRRRGTALRFLTNSTLKSRASAATRLRERGFDVQDGEFLTASSLSAAYLRARQPRSAWVMVEREGLNEFADFVHDEQNPEYIVVGDNRSRFDFDTLNRALRLLKKGARLIGMTSELIDSSLGELELNVGSWVRLLETASGVPAVYIGKPHPYAFELALASLGLDRDSVLMVGDRPTSDILGANRAGLRSLLVRTGEYTPEELYSSGSRPDFVIDDLRFLPEVLAPYLG